jgi:radical SAM-linked protein
VPLAIGVTSECEVMDVWLRRQVSSYFFIKMMTEQLPPGVGILKAEQVALTLPSLQSLIRQTEYRVEIETDKGPEQVEAALRVFLAEEHIPWQHERDTGVRQYDIRALVYHLWLLGWQDSRCVLGMRLRSDSAASGRPEQIAAALGFPERPRSIHRTRLILTGGVAEPDRNRGK